MNESRNYVVRGMGEVLETVLIRLPRLSQEGRSFLRALTPFIFCKRILFPFSNLLMPIQSNAKTAGGEEEGAR